MATNAALDTKVADYQSQIELLRSVVDKMNNQMILSSQMGGDLVQLRDQNKILKSENAKLQAQNADLVSSLNQVQAENMVGNARISKNVQAALSLARAAHEASQKEISDQLSKKTAELDGVLQKCRSLEDDMSRMRSQHEQMITKLSQRKVVAAGTGNEAALRQRIAELEESLSIRDEDSMKPTRGARASVAFPSSSAAKAQSLMKKFKISNSP